MRLIWSLSLLFLSVLLLDACTRDALPEPEPTVCDDVTLTYEADIRDIVERTCAYSGCHLGSAPGVYTDYRGLFPDLDSGRFRDRVIERKDDPNIGMPPNYAPAGRQQDLTAEELEMITCWLEAGYPRE